MIHYENKLNDLFCFRRPTWIIQETSSSSFTPNLFSFLPWRPLQNSEWLTLTSSPTHPVHQGALCSCWRRGFVERLRGLAHLQLPNSVPSSVHTQSSKLYVSEAVQRVKKFPCLTGSGADWVQRRPTNQHVDSAGWLGRLVSHLWWVSNQTRPFWVSAGVAVETAPSEWHPVHLTLEPSRKPRLLCVSSHWTVNKTNKQGLYKTATFTVTAVNFPWGKNKESINPPENLEVTWSPSLSQSASPIRKRQKSFLFFFFLHLLPLLVSCVCCRHVCLSF